MAALSLRDKHRLARLQAYFSGHDHHLEHLRVPKQQHDVDYIISGAGSQVRLPRQLSSQAPSSCCCKVNAHEAAIQRQQSTNLLLAWRDSAPNAPASSSEVSCGTARSGMSSAVQVRPVRDDEKESEFAYYGSGFVQAVLKSELLELKFFGILSVRELPRGAPELSYPPPGNPSFDLWLCLVMQDNHEPIHTVVIPRVPHKGRRRLRGEL